jgi:ABC-type uncharacterized transport system permease subunit
MLIWVVLRQSFSFFTRANFVMIEASLQERLLHNIFLLELLARVGMSLFFGLSVFGFACVLQIKEKYLNLSSLILQVSRILFLLGTISILTYGILEYLLPINSITTELYTLICFIFALGMLFFDPKHKEYPPLSFIIGSVIFLLMTLVSFLEPKVLLPTEKNAWFINLHIILSILGETIFIVSFCASLLFVINHRKLKRKKIASDRKTTSLSTLEKVVVRSSFIGLAFITLALITGLILVFVGKGMPQAGFVKIFWAFFVWGWYAISILGRSFWGWKGRKGAWLIILGSALLLLGLVGNFYRYL